MYTAIGRIIDTLELNKSNRPAYILTVDFDNEIGIKRSRPLITDLYPREEMVGKMVVAVVYPETRIVDTICCEFDVTGFYDLDAREDKVEPIPKEDLIASYELLCRT